MKPRTLCLERLQRIQHVLASHGGRATMRNLHRSFGLYSWEIEQASELGWVSISIHKPRTGRPSRIVEFCGRENAKLPKYRRQIEPEISPRHFAFCIRARLSCHRGSSYSGLSSFTDAYKAVYHPKSRRGAYASVSRLLRHPHVQALRQWFFARTNGEISKDGPIPQTAIAIWQCLREAGSWRAQGRI